MGLPVKSGPKAMTDGQLSSVHGMLCNSQVQYGKNRDRSVPAASSRESVVYHVSLSAALALGFFFLNLPELIVISNLGSVAWYPAAGLALAIMIAISPWYSVLVALCTSIAGILLYHQSLLSYSGTVGALGFAGLYAAAACVLRGPLKIDVGLRQRRDVARYIFVATPAAATSSVVGAACLAAEGSIAWGDYWHTALRWFLGDEVGLLAVAPFFLIHVFPFIRRQWHSSDRISEPQRHVFITANIPVLLEAAAQALAVLAVVWAMFGAAFAHFELLYLSFVPIIWIAVRQGVRRAVSGLLALNLGIAFSLHSLLLTPGLLLKVELLMVVVSATGLIVGSAVSERYRTAKELQQRTIELGAHATALEIIQARLRENQERMTLAFDAAKVGFWDWNIVTGEQVWSANTKKQLGLPEDCPTTFDVLMNAIHSDDRGVMQAAIKAAISDPGDYEVEYRTVWPDGSLHWRLARGRSYRDVTGKPVRMIGVNLDTDERKAGERRLELQGAALQAAANSIVITDAKGIILWANQAFSQLTGYSTDEVQGKNVELLKSGKQDDAFYRNLWQRITAGEIWRGELVNRRKDGGLYTEEMTITPVRSKTGEISHFVAIKQDVTERKQVEIALQEAEAKYRGMFDDAVVGMFQSEPNGRLTSINSAMAQMLGYDSPAAALAEMIDLKCFYVDPRHLKSLEDMLEQSGVVRDFEYEIARRDGTKRHLVANARAVRDQAGKMLYYEGTVQDISERKLLEERFRQAQKMEAVGRLAGGVAHDFNNALSVINGYSEILQLELSGDDPRRAKLEEVRKAGNRAASLTRQLLAFSRKQTVQPVVLDLNSVVSDTEKMLRRLIGEDIGLVFLRESQSPRIKADRGQVEQILMNLAVNARDAMPHGGKLVIRTANADIDPTYIGGHPFAKPGRYVTLSVTDTGVGMDAETRAHIFEPFFTTKEVGKGTGLGLSTVYGIVKQSGGHISVYSELGKGTVFKIYFPEAAEGTPKNQTKSSRAVAPGVETVLLVEDEDALRQLTHECLQSSGYTVLAARDGKEAMELATNYEDAIDLLLTDVIMPEMSGPQVADALLSSRPNLKLLYMSGYTDDLISHHGVLEPEIAFLEKPFNLDSLLLKVREVLDRRSPPVPHRV